MCANLLCDDKYLFIYGIERGSLNRNPSPSPQPHPVSPTKAILRTLLLANVMDPTYPRTVSYPSGHLYALLWLERRVAGMNVDAILTFAPGMKDSTCSDIKIGPFPYIADNPVCVAGGTVEERCVQVHRVAHDL